MHHKVPSGTGELHYIQMFRIVMVKNIRQGNILSQKILLRKIFLLPFYNCISFVGSCHTHLRLHDAVCALIHAALKRYPFQSTFTVLTDLADQRKRITVRILPTRICVDALYG